MKKKIGALLLAFILCFSMIIPAFAEDAEGFTSEYQRVGDFAKLLSDSEIDSLNTKLDEVSQRQNLDVIVLTTNDLEGKSLSDYSETYYESCDFGYGSDKDGVLLLLNMADRDWYIMTHGYGITAFTDTGIQYIGEQIKSDLSDGDYYAAFERFASLCDDFITQARSGSSYDSDALPREPFSWIWLPISIVIGFIIALIAVGCMKGKLKSVRSRAEANSYLKNGSFNVTESHDLFLYRTITQTERPKDDDNSSSSGSSTHTSSSGSTYGGGGGKF